MTPTENAIIELLGAIQRMYSVLKLMEDAQAADPISLERVQYSLERATKHVKEMMNVKVP